MEGSKKTVPSYSNFPFHQEQENKTLQNTTDDIDCREFCKSASSGRFDRTTLPDYQIFSDRLRTFKFWPCGDKISPSELARAGLKYTGQGDRCMCVWCGIELLAWQLFDEPMSEHRRHNKECRYLKMILPS